MAKLLSNLLFVAGLVAFAAVGWWWFAGGEGEQAPAGRPPYVLPVTLADVAVGDLEARVGLTGSVASAHRSRVGFEIEGRIVELPAQTGDDVAAGTVLARLDRRDAEVELAQAQAAEQLATRELERWLAGSREEEKRRLRAVLEAAKAEAELARKEVERGAGLVQAIVISQNDYDTLVARREAFDARVRAAEEALAEAEAGSRPEEIAIARAVIEVRQAAVEAARRELEKTEIRAPFDAAVVDRVASLGDSVQPGDVVFELVDLSRREVLLEVPGHLAPRLGERPRVRLELAEREGFALETDLDTLVAAADEASRTFRGIVRLEPGEDVEHRLKPGMFVRATVALEPLRGAVLVPADAVRVVAAGEIVVKAKQPPAPEGGGPPALAAEWVPVRVLASEGHVSAVEPLASAANGSASGAPSLAAGDRVVVIGVDLAFPGAPLLVREPAAAGGARAP